jgi:outer membrane protein assembly factor BamB
MRRPKIAGRLIAWILPLSCLVGFAWFRPAAGQDWTRFRGPNGSGIGKADLPARWTDKDITWKASLPGVGHSSPVLWGDRLFLTSGEEATGKRIVIGLRASDGSQRWLREIPGQRHRKHADNSFASATPAVDDRHVYTYWGTPTETIVLALDHDGKDVWRADLGPFKGGHGFGASPIVYDDLVIVPNDQDGQSSLVALDRATGKVRWQVPRKSRTTYTTPCVFQPPGRPAELIFTNYEHGISSINPKTGKPNWESDIFSKGHIETSISSPVVAGDLVIGTSGWLGVKKEVIAVRPDRTDAGKPEVVYRIERGAPLVPSPLVKDDLLFLWNDDGMVTCANAATGEVLWRERVPGSYYGSPVCAGRHLYCISREGDVLVLAAAKRFEQLARIPLGEGSHSTPAIAGGRMYLRSFTQLIAIGGKEQK